MTASTYEKKHRFSDTKRLDVLQRGLLTVLGESGWKMEAWAVFSNHYHVVARSPEGSVDASSLSVGLGKLHEKTAKWVNRLDGVAGRKVWHNFRETHLDFEKSYLARLHYVHANAVRHGLVLKASDYPWCSASWFEREWEPSFVKTVYRFKIDGVRVEDDFNPILEE